MDNREISDGAALEAITEAVIGRMFFIRPGIVRAFYPEKNMVDAQVAVKAKRPVIDGKVEYEELPLIVNVPLAVPYSPAAGLGMTFPIRAGDPCTLLFSDRMINLFLHRGEMSLPEENGLDNRTTCPRQHEIEDAICFPGVILKNSVFKDWNNDAVEIRDLERKVYASVSREGITATDGTAMAEVGDGRVTAFAPNGVALTDDAASITIQGGRITLSAPNGITVKAPNMKVDDSSGLLSGTWTAQDFRTQAGFDANSHKHGGVENGPGVTGPFA